MQTPMILSDKKLKYFEKHKNSSQNGREQKEDIQNYDSRFNQNQKFVKYNKELLKNNIDRYSLLNNYNESAQKIKNGKPKSDKNISLNLQININNINFNNMQMIDKNNLSNNRTNTSTLSGKILTKFHM
jgi:hypothetical protein